MLKVKGPATDGTEESQRPKMYRFSEKTQGIVTDQFSPREESSNAETVEKAGLAVSSEVCLEHTFEWGRHSPWPIPVGLVEELTGSLLHLLPQDVVSEGAGHSCQQEFLPDRVARK